MLGKIPASLFTVILASMLAAGRYKAFSENEDNICYQQPESVLQECLSISVKETASKQSPI